MRRILTRLAVLALLALLGFGLLLFAALDSVPLVDRSEAISPNEIAQAKRIITANDPRRLQRGDARQVEIPAALIDGGINYLASRGLHGRGALAMSEESAEVRLTLRISPAPAERYLNLRATIHEVEGEPRIASSAIGSVPIPAALTEFALAGAVEDFRQLAL